MTDTAYATADALVDAAWAQQHLADPSVRFVEVDVYSTDFIPGLGTRHAAAASITRVTRAFAVVVSQSSIVRVFAGGELRAEVLPELFLLARERAFRGASEVRQLPEYGLTLALAGDGAAPAA